MFQPWRFKLKEAEVALEQGRLEDAARLLKEGDLPTYLPAQQLLAPIEVSTAGVCRSTITALRPPATGRQQSPRRITFWNLLRKPPSPAMPVSGPGTKSGRRSLIRVRLVLDLCTKRSPGPPPDQPRKT